MSHKLMVASFTVVLTAVAPFALDEYNPVPARVMQINVGMERSDITGVYQDTWESDGVENENNPLSLPMQGKFGLMDNLEGSMEVNYLIQDDSGHTGLDRPRLALKYLDPTKGLGGFLAIALPVGFEDIMNAGNYATLSFGAMYNKIFPMLNLKSNVSYSFNTEDSHKSKIDDIRFYAKPEYPLPLKALTTRGQYLGLNLALSYDFMFNREVDGNSSDDGAHLFVATPGAYYTLNKIVSAELQFPVTLAGQFMEETRAVRLELFFTLDEGLYNSL
ncbi:MAG: transporter [Fibrobacteres bacterium]|jgi:hypothetical protein|nr:transporter [Fibrobacterota bacterium]